MRLHVAAATAVVVDAAGAAECGQYLSLPLPLLLSPLRQGTRAAAVLHEAHGVGELSQRGSAGTGAP